MNFLKPLALAFGRVGGPFSAGRLRRTELAGFVAVAAASLPVAFYLERHLFEGFIYLWTLLTQLPLACAVVARLHDTGRSGLWGALPVPGVAFGAYLGMLARATQGMDGTLQQHGLLASSVAVAVASLSFLGWQLLSPGQSGPNRFGPDPRERSASPVAV